MSCSSKMYYHGSKSLLCLKMLQCYQRVSNQRIDILLGYSWILVKTSNHSNSSNDLYKSMKWCSSTFLFPLNLFHENSDYWIESFECEFRLVINACMKVISSHMSVLNIIFHTIVFWREIAPTFNQLVLIHPFAKKIKFFTLVYYFVFLFVFVLSFKLKIGFANGNATLNLIYCQIEALGVVENRQRTNQSNNCICVNSFTWCHWKGLVVIMELSLWTWDYGLKRLSDRAHHNKLRHRKSVTCLSVVALWDFAQTQMLGIPCRVWLTAPRGKGLISSFQCNGSVHWL